MIYDISQSLFETMPVWPGDTPFQSARTWHLSEQVPVNVSRVTLSTHSGTHADAPFHYAAHGTTIDRLSLETYIGQAQLIDVSKESGPILIEEIAPHLQADIKRILLRTYRQAPQTHWDSGFRAVDPPLIDYLAEKGVLLIGVDTPSLDPQDSKIMEAHHAILRHDMRVLEGLVLDSIQQGIYELITLPLKLTGLDASPVRAILRDIEHEGIK